MSPGKNSLSLIVACLALAPAVAARAAESERPNIVFIFADDLCFQNDPRLGLR